MPLSNKKLKYLHRHAGRKSAAEIARELNVPLETVTRELGETPETSAQQSKNMLVWMLAGMVFLAPLCFLQSITDFVELPKRAFIQTGSLAIFSLWLFKLSQSLRIKILKSPVYAPLALIILWSLLSLLWANDSYQAFMQGAHWAACGLVFVTAYHILDDNRKINLILFSVFASALLVSLLGLGQHFFAIDWVRQLAPPAATFANRNSASQFVVLCYPLGLLFFLSARKNVTIWAVSMAMTCICAYLYHTFTRAGWLVVSGQTLLFVFYLAYRRFKLNLPPVFRGQRLAAFTSALLVFAILANFSAEGWNRRGDDAFKRLTNLWDNASSKKSAADTEFPTNAIGLNSVSTRKTLYRNTLEIIKQHPLAGVGLDNFVAHYPASTMTGWRDKEIGLHKQQAKVHNDFLQITAELGVPALVALLWGFVVLMRALPNIFSGKQTPEDRDTGFACLAGILGLAANAAVSFPMYLAIPPFILALYAAIYLRLSGQRSETKQWIISRRKVVFSLGILVAAVLTVWIFWQHRVLRADWYYNGQSITLMDRKYKESVRWGMRAHQWNPFRMDVHNYLGRALLKVEDRERAIQHLERYNAAYPYATFNLYYLALCYKELNEYAKAKPLVERALKILPDEGRLRDLMGWTYSGLNQREKALVEFRLAARLKPEKINYHYNQGVTAYLLGHYEEAARVLTTSVDLKGDYFPARRFLALILIQHLNRVEEGIVHLKEALVIKPLGKESEFLRNLLKNLENTES